MEIDLDPFLKSSQVAKARGCSTRWLRELVAAEKFPAPDRPARARGEPSMWRLSTVKRALEQLQSEAQQ